MSIGPSDSYASLSGSSEDILSSWSRGWTPPDRRKIHEWASEHVDLQGDYAKRGRFRIDDSRYLALPFELLGNDVTRMLNILKAVQTFGSGLGDLLLQWVFANAPGPYMATFQSDDDAEQHYLTRVKPTFEATSVNRDLFLRLHRKRDLYQWPNMNAYVQGANMNSLQRKSIQYEVNDEVWTWKPKMMEEAFNRTEAFKRICKILNISQGGYVGSDWEVVFNAGRRYDYGIRCQNPACGRLQPYDFFALLEEHPNTRAGIVWSDDARRPDGTWNHTRVAETTRFRCRYCGHEHPDTPRTWEAFNRTGDYICRDPDRPLTNCSLRWTSLVRGTWADLAIQFIQATALQHQGSTAALEAFYQKKLALFWDPSMGVQRIALSTADYIKESPLAPGYKHEPIPGERHRFLVADYQEGRGNEGRHLWANCRAWREKGKGSRLLNEGRVRTFDDLRALQLALGVSDACTCVDGSFEMMEVAAVCARYGWTMLRGDPAEFFNHPAPKGKHNAKPKRRPFSRRQWIDPHKGKASAGRLGCWCFYWSNPSVKNILWRLRHGHGAAWELPSDLSPEYRHQIDSEHKVRAVNKKTGAVEYIWQKYKEDNHAWDNECQQVVCALIASLIDWSFDDLDQRAAQTHVGEAAATADAPADEPAAASTTTPAESIPVAPANAADLIPPHDQPEQLTLLTA